MVALLLFFFLLVVIVGGRRRTVLPFPAVGGRTVHRRLILGLVLDAAEREILVIRHERIRIAQLGRVGGTRTGIEIAEDLIVLLALLGDADGAVRIEDVAEDDGVHGAGLLAGGLDLAIRDGDVAGVAGLGRLDLVTDLAALDAREPKDEAKQPSVLIERAGRNPADAL